MSNPRNIPDELKQSLLSVPPEMEENDNGGAKKDVVVEIKPTLIKKKSAVRY